MKRIFLIAAVVACLAACSGLDKGTVVENGSKARLFVANYGMPSPALIQSHKWAAVKVANLAQLTWHTLPTTASSNPSRYSLLEQPGTGTLYLAREGETSNEMRVSKELEVFGPIVLGSGT